MAKKRNIIVGQSGGPTSVINSSLAGVYKNAIETRLRQSIRNAARNTGTSG